MGAGCWVLKAQEYEKEMDGCNMTGRNGRHGMGMGHGAYTHC